MRTALIVGAGIGGLAAGIALRRAGWQVRIHERAAQPRELGFALLLAPNAMAALRELGVDEVMIAEGVATTKVEIRRPDGSVIRKFDAQLGGPAVVALRPVLHGALLNAVGYDALILDSHAVDFTLTSAGIGLNLANGRTEAGDVLIGADGVDSVIRKQLHPQASLPHRSRFCALRGVAYGVGDNLGDLAGVGYLGDGIEAATARAGQNAVYWYVSLLADDVSTTLDPMTILKQHTIAFEPRFHAIVTATRPEDMRFDKLFECKPLKEWGTGPVTLLGDAAHPLLPHTAQGAAQALEDAVALGIVLSRPGNVEPALRQYEFVRSRRTQRLIQLGPWMASFTTTRNPLLQWLRNTMIRCVPGRIGAVAWSRRDPHRALRSTS